jgi:hypothetical protein
MSPLRIGNLCIAVGVSIIYVFGNLVGATDQTALLSTPISHVMSFASIVAWVAYIGLTVRDQILDRLDRLANGIAQQVDNYGNERATESALAAIRGHRDAADSATGGTSRPHLVR